MKRVAYTHTDGTCRIISPPLNTILTVEEIMAVDVPDPVGGYDPEPVIIDAADLPQDQTFFNAWRISGAAVATDIPAAKLLAHDMRRRARDLEMKPLDIQATIPSQATAAEAARQVIRDKYATVQTDIDAAVIEADLLGIVQGFPVEE